MDIGERMNGYDRSIS